MDMCAYRPFGRCYVRPDLDATGEGKYLATATPVHGREINGNFRRLLFQKEWDVHRPVGCQVVVGAEAEGRKMIEVEVGNPGPAAVWQSRVTVPWMLTTIVFRCSQKNLRLSTSAFYATRRTYALSRFPQRSPGVGRRRQHVENDNYRGSTSRFKPAREEVPREDKPSSEASPLWQESARSFKSDPAEGLRRLLMTHDSLVVTRLALLGLAARRNRL